MDKKLDNRKRISPSVTAFIGALITLVGGFFLSYNYVQEQKVLAFDYMASTFYNGKEVENLNVNIVEDEEGQRDELKPTEFTGEVRNDYIGYLSIPKINLTKGFLDYRSPENNVDKNILVVQGSNYPDTEKGNFIIAGHSGTGWNSFFNDLYQLGKGDKVYITYQDKKYEYEIVNIYTQPKIGKLAIYRDYEKTTLTLITCTNNDSTTQTVYIAERVSVTE